METISQMRCSAQEISRTGVSILAREIAEVCKDKIFKMKNHKILSVMINKCIIDLNSRTAYS